MKNNIEMYFEKLTNDYDKEEVNIVPSNIKEEELKYVPEALHELYKVISKAELPFGEIFSIDDALKKYIPTLSLEKFVEITSGNSIFCSKPRCTTLYEAAEKLLRMLSRRNVKI